MKEDITSDLLKEIKTNEGQDLYSMTFDRPVLLVFLRQFGCVFCQEAIKELQRKHNEILSKGVKLCFVHMASIEEGDEYFKKYGISQIAHVSDPQCKYYAAFGLVKGRFNQLFGLQVWLRTIESVVVDNNTFFTKQIGDGFQMPGVFFLKDGQVNQKFVHSKVSDRPDYLNLIQQ